jgi:hypothetical protein
MSKNSVSEWSTVSSGNGDIAGFTLGLDMPPSYVNNSIQEMMAQIKQWKDGYTDPVTGLPVYQSITAQNVEVIGINNIKGQFQINGNTGTLGQVLTSNGAGSLPNWTSKGTMSTQNSNAVNITGGTITGTKVNNVIVGTNASGNKTISTSAPSGGQNGDIWYQI